MSEVYMRSYISTALQTLLFTSDSLEETQKRVSSGLKVASAADDAGYWSTANRMTSDQSVYSSIEDSLSLGASKVDTAYAAVDSAIDILDEITSQLVSAYEEGSDRDSINQVISSLKENLSAVVENATFSGDNWLYNDEDTLPTSKTVPGSFQRSNTGAVSLQYISIDTSLTTLIDTSDASRGLLTNTIDANTLNPDGTATARNYYLLDADSTTGVTGTEIAVSDSTTQDELDDMIAVMAELTSRLSTVGSELGTMSNSVEQQSTYASNLQDILDEGVGRLVDADAEEESTRLTAYETQQTLASNLISILNDHSKSIQVLFQ